MSEYLYILTGRVIPERAVVDICEVAFKVPVSEDVPEGDLFIQIIKSQIFVRFLASGEVRNIFTLRNIVEDATRMLLDVIGYLNGYGYDVEIIQAVQPNTGEKYVFGIDVPVLAGVCEKDGITYSDIFMALSKTDGYYLRRALADVREAMKSPMDTGFFCYRAIESLKNCYAKRSGLKPDDAQADAQAWELFRNKYSVPKQEILGIKTFADPVRHGNYPQAKPLTDKDRADVFKKTWEIIN
ncbi:MAG TPA: hypothetical protein GXX25_08400 [Desulfotomaculum sp.]|nr:hypothetical protein [Desulfotomaculum sp.]